MATSTSTNETQIRALIENWARAVRNKDIDGVLAQHASDLVMFDVPPPVQLRGLDAYAASWDQFWRWYGERGAFEVSELSVTADEAVAFCHGLIHCAGTDPAGRAVPLVLRLTVGLRQIGGQWIITHEHHSEPSD